MLAQFDRFVRSRKGQAAAVLVVLAVGLAAAQTLYKKEAGQGKPQAAADATAAAPAGAGPANFVTHAAPRDLPELALRAADGTAASLEAFRGELLVVNYWATWCAPCRKEMPQLDALAGRYQGRGVRVIALSVDRGSADKPQAFLDGLGVKHLTRLYDPSYKSARSAGLIGLPTTLLVGRDGREIGRLAGEADWDAPAVHALIDAYLEN